MLFKEQPAGILEETAGGGSRFVYDAGWTTPVACALPVLRREHDWPIGLHPFFQHLGPEGWLRERQARVAHLAEEDDFGLLLRYGGDCIGAVGLAGATGDGRDGGDVLTEAATRGARTLSGVQPKLLVNRQKGGAYRPAGIAGPAACIAKFNSVDRPDLVRNELLSLRWTAAVLGAAEVTAFAPGQVLLGDGDRRAALVVTRFDRTADGAKLRLEDGAQILGKPRGADYNGKYEAAYEDVARAIREHSARPEIDLAKLFLRLAAFAILGNCDAHLKNFSLLETPDGLRLSPAYDVVNTLLYPDLSTDFGLYFDDRRLRAGQVDRAVLAAFGRRIGLGDAAIALAFEDVARGVKRAAKHLVPPEAEDAGGFITRYAEIVRAGCRRILETP